MSFYQCSFESHFIVFGRQRDNLTCSTFLSKYFSFETDGRQTRTGWEGCKGKASTSSGLDDLFGGLPVSLDWTQAAAVLFLVLLRTLYSSDTFILRRADRQ